jgi:hypothetical protein
LKKYIKENGHANVPAKFKYKDCNLGAWVFHQKSNSKILDENRFKLLELLPQWTWNVLEDKWFESFEYLKKYIKENGHANVPMKFKYKDCNLGAWVGNQRRISTKQDVKRIKLLESLPQWSWDVLEVQWLENFEYLKKYAKENGHAIVPARFKYKDCLLGRWVRRQRESETLDEKKISLLESLPKWAWDPLEVLWNENFEYLKKYVKENGHANMSRRVKYRGFNLGAWVNAQKLMKEKLTINRRKLLESLPGWKW